jgi:hypothetical protein
LLRINFVTYKECLYKECHGTPTMYTEQNLCQTCHTLFSGGQDRQELFMHVEAGSPDGNFDTLGKSFFASQNKNFNFGTTKTLILHAPSIFFKGGHLTKIRSTKYFS